MLPPIDECREVLPSGVNVYGNYGCLGSSAACPQQIGTAFRGLASLDPDTPPPRPLRSTPPTLPRSHAGCRDRSPNLLYDGSPTVGSQYERTIFHFRCPPGSQ